MLSQKSQSNYKPCSQMKENWKAATDSNWSTIWNKIRITSWQFFLLSMKELHDGRIWNRGWGLKISDCISKNRNILCSFLRIFFFSFIMFYYHGRPQEFFQRGQNKFILWGDFSRWANTLKTSKIVL